MGSWNDILKEVNETQSQYDYVRRKYLKELSDYTGRNTVAYYSSWLNKQGNNLDINDADMTGFMTWIRLYKRIRFGFAYSWRITSSSRGNC